MAIVDSPIFSLEDVRVELLGSNPFSLSTAFGIADPEKFDLAYDAVDNRMSRFQNYGVIDCTLNVTGSESLIPIAGPTPPGTPTFNNTTTSGYLVSFTAGTAEAGLERYEFWVNDALVPNGVNLTYQFSVGAGIVDDWKVRTVDINEQFSEWSDISSWGTLCAAPVLTLDGQLDNAATLSRNDVTGAISYWMTQTGPYNTSFLMDTNPDYVNDLPPGTWTFTLQARNAFGLDSALSNSIVVVISAVTSQVRYAGDSSSDNYYVDTGPNWSNLTGCRGYTNLTDSYVEIVTQNWYTDWLYTKNFGFSIPAGATIDGIELTYYRQADVGGGLPLNREIQAMGLRLVTTSWVTSGEDTKDRTSWHLNGEEKVIGGPTDLWDAGASWTPALINSSDFGMQVSAQAIGGAPITARVRWVKIEVTYTE